VHLFDIVLGNFRGRSGVHGQIIRTARKARRD
jgi:hypothetical protein